MNGRHQAAKRAPLTKNTVQNPPSIEPALAKLVEALARQAARDDYAREMAGGTDDEESGDLRQVQQRSSDR